MPWKKLPCFQHHFSQASIEDPSGFWARQTFDLTQQDRGAPHCHPSYTESSPEHSDCIHYLRRTGVDQNWLCQFELLMQFLLLLCLVHQHEHLIQSKICSKSFWRKHFSKISWFNSSVEIYYETNRILFHSWDLIYFFQISFYVLVSRTCMSRN